MDGKKLLYTTGLLAALGLTYLTVVFTPWGEGRPLSRMTGVSGFGRMRGTNPGSGPGGYCECPACGAVHPHNTGAPCYLTPCPVCGAKM
ncbi:MAG: hypothetical protein WC455_12975, partial [Dehalococcoidia bacterium]